MAYVRTVKTASGGEGGADRALLAGRGSRDIEHIALAHDDAAHGRRQPEIDLGLGLATLQAGGGVGAGPLAITS